MPPARNASNAPVTGILCIVSGLFLFALQDVVIKHFSGGYSVLQIVVTRGLVAVAIVALVVVLVHGRDGYKLHNPRLVLSKGFLAFFSYLTYYLAVASMPLADVVAITFSAPIFVTVMSALMLGECVGLRRWLAVMSGFVGVLLVIGPGGQIGNIAVAFAGIAALTYALSSVIARYIGPEDKPWTVTLYFTLSHLVGGLLTSLVVTALDSELYTDHPSLAFLLRPWSIGGGIDTALMGLLGINAAFGFYLLNRAYLSAPASTVAPFEYTFVLWAVLFGFVFWSEVPTTATIAGIAVLISSNLYILQRQTRNGGLRGVEGAASTPYSAEKLARA